MSAVECRHLGNVQSLSDRDNARVGAAEWQAGVPLRQVSGPVEIFDGQVHRREESGTERAEEARLSGRSGLSGQEVAHLGYDRPGDKTGWPGCP